jgi:arylsulfatase A-like enzyme
MAFRGRALLCGLLAWSTAAALLALAGCSEPAPEPAPPPTGDWPPIVLVTLDTVRADHLSLYGYERPTSPQLEALAERATVYRRAMASSPWTLPSHASLLTGLDPSHHGAVTHLEAEDRTEPSALAPERVTLAEALRAEGYATGAFLANRAYLSARFGLDQGFDTYDVEPRSAPEINAAARRFLEERGDRPAFLFLNYLEAHRPYNTRLPVSYLERPPPSPRESAEDVLALYEAVMPGLAPGPPELVARVTDAYDVGISSADAGVGDLVAMLEGEGILDEALLVVTSDHGEFLGEHMLVEHSKDVYQPVLAVPLVIKAPGQREARSVDRPVASSDVPLLMAEALPAALGERVRSALGAGSGGGPLLAENRYSRAKDLSDPRWRARMSRVRRAVIDWPWKLIESSDGTHELYDLEADPDETHDRMADAPEVAARLRAHLRERLQDAPGETALPAAPTAEEMEALRALGYVE